MSQTVIANMRERLEYFLAFVTRVKGDVRRAPGCYRCMTVHCLYINIQQHFRHGLQGLMFSHSTK